MSLGSRTLLLATLAIAGCAAQKPLQDPLDQTGSSSMIASSSRQALYALNVDEGTLSVLDAGTGEIKQEIAVGREPTRIARSGSKVYVTLRAERGIAVLDETADGLTLDRVVPTGAEPFGIVASEDGSLVYVALSTEDQVQELDASTMAVVRTFAVEGQPRWIALAPNNSALYVGSAFGGEVHWIDLGSGDVNGLVLPTAANFEGDELTIRITGDLSVSPDGGLLAIPLTYVDNVRTVGDPQDDVVTQDGYSGGVTGTARFNPAVVVANLSTGGRPSVIPNPLSVSGGSGGEFFDTGGIRNDAAGSVPAPYIASLTFSPDSLSMYATFEATSSVAVISTDTLANDRPALDQQVSPQPFEFAVPATAFVSTGHGPRAVAFLDDSHAYTYSFLDRSVTDVKSTWARSVLHDQITAGFASSSSQDGEFVAQVAQASLPSDIEEGRRLFYSADDSQMSAGGVSCATCHFDARNDGLTWTFHDGAVHHQTPSLAGPVSLTAPMTWNDQVPDVSTEAHITSQGRMGGQGLQAEQETMIARFVDSTRDADVPMKGSDDPAIARGKAIFERSDVACASCHSGTRYTDNRTHDLFGERATNTPGLVGVAATGPYLHDGRAKDLDAVLELTDRALMGDTSTLSSSEKADLKTYLESL